MQEPIPWRLTGPFVVAAWEAVVIAEDLILTLDAGDGNSRGAAGGRRSPYHRQLYEQIRAAILAGRLRPGDRLPATRDLALRLGIARNTVARAYGDLLAEGYLEGKVGSGTYVAPELGEADRSRTPRLPAAGAATRSVSGWASRALREARTAPQGIALPYDFRPGTPDWDAFPRTLWLRLLGRALRCRAAELTRYGDPAGYYPLREAIARHLAVSRGVAASADQVVIVSGSQQTLDLLARLRVEPGDAVAVEDPGYPEARRAFVAAAARVLAVPVDEEGLDVAALARQASASPPRLVYVTPSHQFPTGATLSLGRRLALLEWSARHDTLVVEDDYDAEFRYTGRPVESLQGLDRAARVVYVGTFSTVLFPPFRVGYAVLPADLVEPFVQAKWLADRQTATLEQLALADFLAEGHFERHLRRMRRLAAARRGALLAAVGEHLGGLVALSRAETGMHVMLTLQPGEAGPAAPAAEGGTRLAAPDQLEAAVTARAAERGVGVYPVGPCRARRPERAAIVLGFAALPEARIREGVRRLAAAVREALSA